MKTEKLKEKFFKKLLEEAVLPKEEQKEPIAESPEEVCYTMPAYGGVYGHIWPKKIHTYNPSVHGLFKEVVPPITMLEKPSGKLFKLQYSVGYSGTFKYDGAILTGQENLAEGV